MHFVCDSVSFNGHQVNVKSLTWGLENASEGSVSCSSQWVENPFLNWGGRRIIGTREKGNITSLFEGSDAHD